MTLPQPVLHGSTTLLDALRRAPIFADCSDTSLTAIVEQAHTETAAKGKILFLNGDEATSFFYVTQGWVKLFRETLDGTQAIVDILPQGSIFGETAIFGDGVYPYSVEAVEDCKLLRIPLSALKRQIEEEPKLAFGMLKSMARHRRQQDQELEHRTLQSAPQRIGCFLLRLLPANANQNIVLNLPYDKSLLAARLGMQPETFSRALGKLKDETGIKIVGARVEIADITQLSHFACSACSSHFPCSDH